MVQSSIPLYAQGFSGKMLISALVIAERILDVIHAAWLVEQVAEL